MRHVIAGLSQSRSPKHNKAWNIIDAHGTARAEQGHYQANQSNHYNYKSFELAVGPQEEVIWGQKRAQN